MIPLESDYTASSAWCPEPARWHAPDGLATETEVTELVHALIRATQPSFVLETGTYRGHTTMAIGMALAANGHGHAHSLELDNERATAAARACAGLPVNIVHGLSLNYTPPEPIDFAWLDSEIDQRPLEVERFWPHFTDGAIVAVHDTAPHHVDETHIRELTRGMPALNLRTPRGVVIFQVAK